ncbi:putative mitochondrial hydrolase fmp41 [Hanseniaspora vineae]
MSYQYLKNARKVICIGRNYAAHIKELNNPTPKQPFFFLKPTSAIITPITTTSSTGAIPPHARYPSDSISSVYTYKGLQEDGTNPSPIYIPKGVNVHHEVEIALILDKYISNAKPGVEIPVYDAIRGVSLALDLTARNVQNEAKKKGLPWTIGKGFDTFLPMSAFISKDKLVSTENKNFQKSFDLTCKVNNVLRQDGNSELMLNSFSKILQHISTMISLEPGDIVLTGTPAGVGSLNPGDSIECTLSQNGKQLVDMQFDCFAKPGPYEYKET